nr:zinc finger, CCHC-type [Tanacetum cinerariifolium]
YAEFFEKSLITQEVTERAIDLEEIQDEDTSPSKITKEIPMEVEGFESPQKEVILIRRSERTHRAPNRLCLNVEAEEHSLGDLNEPTSHKAAMLDLESNKWIDAMNAKMQSMVDNMKVCKLQRSMYGLKQASISWNKRFDEEIKKFGFAQNLDEPCVYPKASGSNVTFLILYIDDIIIMENYNPSLQSVKDYLGKFLAMKDLGEATFILGIKIYRDRDDTKSQTGYVFVLNGGLGIVPTINKPIKMFCENSAALLIAKEPGFQKGAGHYHRRYHYVRECIELGEINLPKVHTYDNLADPFMKALLKGKLTQHARSIGLRLASSFM